MVSVTYHRTCLIVAGDNDNLQEAVRQQLNMDAPSLDTSEWSEDEFSVIDCTDRPLGLTLCETDDNRNKRIQDNESPMCKLP